ncbi:MAG: hypothetical protein M0Q24_11505 [Sulfurimonas sp.]|uniref:portal protein n=1 Tax=Sulfurimonas sp. TaxID=2022749 RepID=UPI0025EDE115|nr:hypothetical protein [Sulfurimonas sp.]MCK9492697.1 hypothetical protein [Sulfurimonas sp.]
MQLLEEYQKRKKIKVSDEDLFDMVSSDKDEAERYFDAHIAPSIIRRYELLHSNKQYYEKLFPKLSEASSFSATDVKDIVEWLMPSFTEVYFGADKIVGIFGRTPDDDPEVLEKVIQYQMQTQNNGYVIIDQWIRDAVESGLGVTKLDWEIVEEKKLNWYQATAAEFYSIPVEIAEQSIKKVEALPDGTYKLLVRERVKTKDQPVLRNIKPGEYIFLPDEDNSGRNVFECYRHYMLYDDIRRMGKTGAWKNTEDDFPFVDTEAGQTNSMDTIFDAIRNYQGEDDQREGYLDVSTREGQEGRRRVIVYDCYGKYDVDGDGLLENVHAIICNGRVLFAEINEYERNPFFTISFYANSYQKWKEAVADYLQDIQDLKTALIRQIIINTAINNNRSFGVDINQPAAIEDIQSGKQMIRVELNGQKSISDLLQAMPKYELAPETMPLIEIAGNWSEQRTGITKYNQGLDSDSLNKTATGITKIMAASQQRTRKMARDGAENGMVPLYKHLITLDKKHLDKEFAFRLTNQYYEFHPDDIKGEFDVQVTSNIGLQDKQLTVQNLMLMFAQILPPLLQMGAASPQGMYETAKQIIEEMGFTNPDKFIGIEAGQAGAAMQTQALLQQLPQMLGQILQSAGLDPETGAKITQALMAGIQQAPATTVEGVAA